MRYLTLGELIELHRRIIEQSGGAGGIRDLGWPNQRSRSHGRLLVAQNCIRHSPKKRPLYASRWS
ncbi:MAG: hypothetical protein KatS3mg105_5241 [Gemmatales bacterium]|nr:MAG: hypothetical protein KatS3mg105_5241 [Gemmatales bacterium]GIX01056.1 MAG: hypothetical protein KatS3mg111_4388 [Pirellulaceae bacterium]